MFSKNITKLNQALKKCSVTAGASGIRLASSHHTSDVFRTHTLNVEVDSKVEEYNQINKIPNIKGFEILRNPKLNKVYYIKLFLKHKF